MATALPMQIFYKIFKPFIHTLNWVSAKTANLFGLEATSEHASIYISGKSSDGYGAADADFL